MVEQDLDDLPLNLLKLQALGTHGRVSVQGVDNRTLDFDSQVEFFASALGLIQAAHPVICRHRLTTG